MKFAILYIIMPFLFLMSLDWLFGTHLVDDRWIYKICAIDCIQFCLYNVVGEVSYAASVAAITAFFDELEMVHDEQSGTENKTGRPGS